MQYFGAVIHTLNRGAEVGLSLPRECPRRPHTGGHDKLEGRAARGLEGNKAKTDPPSSRTEEVEQVVNQTAP